MPSAVAACNSTAAALQDYGVLDSPNEPSFDAVVREAAALIGTSMELVSLLDFDRQWFKAKVGLTISETPLCISFCTHAVRGSGTLTVEDATRDERFAANPLVTGDPGIRFYAGTSLTTPDGKRIGTLCVLDGRPRGPLTAAEQASLEKLAEKTMSLMEARKPRAALQEPITW